MSKKVVLHKNSVAAEMLAAAKEDEDGNDNAPGAVDAAVGGNETVLGVAFKKKGPRQSLTVNLPKELWDRIDRAVRELGTTRSSFVGGVMRQFLDKYEGAGRRE